MGFFNRTDLMVEKTGAGMVRGGIVEAMLNSDMEAAKKRVEEATTEQLVELRSDPNIMKTVREQLLMRIEGKDLSDKAQMVTDSQLAELMGDKPDLRTPAITEMLKRAEAGNEDTIEMFKTAVDGMVRNKSTVVYEILEMAVDANAQICGRIVVRQLGGKTEMDKLGDALRTKGHEHWGDVVKSAAERFGKGKTSTGTLRHFFREPPNTAGVNVASGAQLNDKVQCV